MSFRKTVLPLASLIALAALVPLLAGCASSRSSDLERRLEARRIEETPSGPPPEREAAGLRDPANRVPAEITVPGGGKAPKCPADASAFVRDQTGKDCDSYKAEIAGWAERCVAKCDDAKRLAEAVAAAQKACAAFCKEKNCPGPRYSPPAKCAASGCAKLKLCDPQQCPFNNDCYLLQANRVWNCICLEL